MYYFIIFYSLYYNQGIILVFWIYRLTTNEFYIIIIMVALQNICFRKSCWIWLGWDDFENSQGQNIPHSFPLPPQTQNHLWSTDGIQCIVVN